MICVTIAQESRRLALADMLNAVMMGADLLEVRLDAFEHAPQFEEMLSAKRKPLLFSCRRTQDGGLWKGTEEERLILLRQGVLSKADYVEIELDVADQIRPFPGCQRVISYTNLKETPPDIADVYDEMQTKKPDVIKLTCKARTPEEAWPLVQLLAKAPVPTVIVGLGRPGVMLAILGRKIGAPWTVAALEKGMEAYPGQPTVRELEEIYAYREIERSTKLVGVTGMSEQDQFASGLLNAAFREAKTALRCWPLQVGNWKLFRKIIEAVKLQGVAVEDDFLENVHQAAFLDESARAPVQAADWMYPGEEGWVGSNLSGEAVLQAVLEIYRHKEPDNPEPLKGKTIMLAGVEAKARMMVSHFREQGAALIFASRDKASGQRLAQSFGGRFILWDAIYQTFHDILILGRDGKKEETEEDEGENEMPLHPGYLRQGMIVLDIQAVLNGSKFLREAKLRGCLPVTPRALLVERARAIARRATGMEIQRELLTGKLAEWKPEEE